MNSIAYQKVSLYRQVWACITADGNYNAASVYELFLLARLRSQCAQLIWQKRAPSRIKFFMWLATKGRCLTADNLQKRGWPHDASCGLCNAEMESCNHLLMKCPLTNRVWRMLMVCWFIWKERNARIFEHVSKSATQLFWAIREEIIIWREAGIFKQVD
uniref:Cyst nematode resistance protein-like n=1 Tax=Oryza sativa subsp. japonica TaxID=39947 RepID=Q6ZIA0_ORYSJ|nr:cyst nematode resistance protein-like [Oryza sativa Japonica Group]BAD09120.1 cyst nematode resistance protein-like [Oryza sativa Japonica Group]